MGKRRTPGSGIGSRSNSAASGSRIFRKVGLGKLPGLMDKYVSNDLGQLLVLGHGRPLRHGCDHLRCDGAHSRGSSRDSNNAEHISKETSPGWRSTYHRVRPGRRLPKGTCAEICQNDAKQWLCVHVCSELGPIWPTFGQFWAVLARDRSGLAKFVLGLANVGPTLVNIRQNSPQLNRLGPPRRHWGCGSSRALGVRGNTQK